MIFGFTNPEHHEQHQKFQADFDKFLADISPGKWGGHKGGFVVVTPDDPRTYHFFDTEQEALAWRNTALATGKKAPSIYHRTSGGTLWVPSSVAHSSRRSRHFSNEHLDKLHAFVDSIQPGKWGVHLHDGKSSQLFDTETDMLVWWLIATATWKSDPWFGDVFYRTQTGRLMARAA